MVDLQRKILDLWQEQAGRYILWLPLFLALGAGWYLILDHEPYMWVTLPFLLCALVTSGLFWNRLTIRIPAIVILIVAIGFAAGQVRTHTVAAPVIPSALEFKSIEAVLDEKSRKKEGFKLTLRNPIIEELEPENTPTYINVSIRSLPDNIGIGDRIRFTATLYPPPRAAYSGGFDFERYFYFKQIGAMGFALPDSVTVVSSAQSSVGDKGIEALRFAITERIRSSIGEPEGAIAAAFITGDTRGIPDELMDAMRDAGVYHLLAVSGMNLVIVSGILFFLFRAVIALIPPLAIRIHPNKWAAGFALLGTYFYLLIAGSPVSAERAFVMIFLVLFAVMLDRAVTPMRSLMLAAFLILLIQPESLLNASFHLSFAATIGLIAWYEMTHAELKKRADESGWHWKVRFYMEGVLLTSFVAWVCTTPFVMYHFQQIAIYSLPANLICVPLVSILVMPALVIALFLMPLGLHSLPLLLVGWSLRMMSELAVWFSQLPDAVRWVPPMQDWGILVATFGLLWLALWNGKVRWLGMIPVAISMISLMGFTPPQIIVSEGGRQAMFYWQGRWVLARGKSGMQIDQWKEWVGADTLVPVKEAVGLCDRAGCFVPYEGFPVSLVFSGHIQNEECRDAALVLFPLFDGHCSDTSFINREVFTKNGTAAIWISNGNYRVQYSNTYLSQRPWHTSSWEKYKTPAAPEEEASPESPSGAVPPPR